MSLLQNISGLVEKKEDFNVKTPDHEKEKASISNKVNPYMKGVPATADVGSLRAGDVHDLLKAAQKKDEEVETITFGLETEEGDIVKVYVNVDDADKFEHALSKLLGKEDDIEKALSELSNEFDIVDVKWPDNDAEEEIDDEDKAAEKIMANDDEEEPEGTKKTSAPAELTNSNVPEEKEMSKSFKSLFNDVEPLTEKTKPEVVDSLWKQTIKANKDEKKAEKEEVKDDDDDEFKQGKDPIAAVIKGDALEFQRELTNRYQKIAFETVYLLGIPMRTLLLKRAAYKRNLRATSEQIIDNSQLRVWLKRLVIELAKMEIAREAEASAGVKEAKEEDDTKLIKPVMGSKLYDTLQNKIQREVYKFFVAMGVPEDAINQRRSDMRNLIRSLGVILQKKQRLRIIFRMVLSALNILEGGDKVMAEELLEAQSMFEADPVDGALPVDENAAAVLKLFANQSTYGSWLFLKVAFELGIPPAALASKTNLFKTKLISSLRGKANAITKLVAFAEVMGIDTKLPANEERESFFARRVQRLSEKQNIDIAAEIEAEADAADETKIAIKNAKQKDIIAADLGKWNIGQSGDRVFMSIGDKKIELDDDQYEKVIDALADGHAVSVLVDNKRVSFRPEKHGKIYIVKWNEPHPAYPDGVLLDEKSISVLLSIGEKM